MNSMLNLFKEVGSERKIWASFLRLRETHLWDQIGFKVLTDQYLKPEWILWAAFLGGLTVEFKNEFFVIQNPKIGESENFQIINGLTSDRNGLISLNFQSVAEQKEDFDELERGYKPNTFGRLLPGLSYKKEDGFGVIGCDGTFDRIDFVKGLDEEGFLVKK